MQAEDYLWESLNDVDVSRACAMLLELRGRHALARPLLDPTLPERDELMARVRGLTALGDARTLGALSRTITEAYEIDARFVIRRALRAMAALGGTDALVGVVSGFAECSWVHKEALRALDTVSFAGRKQLKAVAAANHTAYLWVEERRKRALEQVA